MIVGRANLAESGRSIVGARPPPCTTPGPTARFLSALRRANVHGALDLGIVARAAARAGHPRRRPRLVRRALARGARRAGASTPPGILRAAADGKIDALVLLGADPLADFPDRDLAERALAGARTVIAVDSSSPTSVEQADVVLPVAGYAEVDGHDDQPRGPGLSRVAARSPPPAPPRPTG